MLNALWPILIIISIFYGIYTGNVAILSEAIFNSSKEAVNLALILIGTMCLWNGLIEIVSNTNLIERIIRLLNPIINYLFPSLRNEKELKKEISLNIVANMLGMGNASTPSGIRAIEKMQNRNLNKEELSEDMVMMIIINTLSIQIIPTTIISIRMSLGSLEATKIIFPVWISSICSGIIGVFLTKLSMKIERKK